MTYIAVQPLNKDPQYGDPPFWTPPFQTPYLVKADTLLPGPEEW